MFFSPSPGPAKHVLSKMGVCTDEVRLPIVMPDAATRARIDAAMDAAGLG
jgi:4-hydroxy-tetrahydrodipicolinate synthase